MDSLLHDPHMKVLLVTFSDNADHQDTMFGLFVELQKAPNYDVTLMAIKDPKVPYEASDKLWLVDCPKRPGITKGTFNLSLLKSIVKRIKKEKFDVIWFESLHVWNVPIMMVLRKHAHIYHVIHEVIPHEGDKQVGGVDFMNRVICKYAKTIVLRNKRYLSAMVERYNLPSERVQFLELWRRFPEYTPPTCSKRVLFFGRINPYKGADNLLEIVRRCPNVQFDVIGRVDPQMEEVVQALSKEKNVCLNTNYVSNEEMRDAFIKCDWVIVPYNSASQSGVIIDAYKYSRPVVAFPVGAISEQVADGKSGFLVREMDNEHFARMVDYVVGMPDEIYTTFAKYAYKYGSEKYAVSHAIPRFRQLLEEGNGQ